MLKRGLVDLDNGRNEKAVAAFSESLRLSPDDADAHYNRGLAHVRLGNFEAAREDYSAAIRLRPEFSEAYTNRAVTFARRGQLDKAIADCTEAIRLKPDNALAFRNRGLANHEQRKYALALADFNQAIRLDDGLAEAYFNRAHSYLALGQKNEAATDFAEAHRLDPKLNIPDEYRNADVAKQASPLPAPGPESIAAGPPPASEASSGESNVDVAAEFYKTQGFTVEAATEPESCELVCRRGDEHVRVEIKLLSDDKATIRVSADEVEKARDPSTRTDLIALLAEDPRPASSTSPGLRILTHIRDWNPGDDDLKPVEFEYGPKPAPAPPRVAVP